MKLLLGVLLFVLTTLMVLVEGRYEFEVRILSFANPSNTDANGASCDVFDSSCEYIFRFCLSLPSSSNCELGVIITEPHYLTGSPHTFTLGQPLISGSGISNPLVYRDVFMSGNKWPVGVELRIQVDDYDPILGNDEVDFLIPKYPDPDSLTHTLYLLPQSTFSPEATYHGNRNKVSMNLQFRVQCQLHWYGDDCLTYCVPQNDAAGHWSCDEDGVRLCLEGYTGLPSCTTIACEPACVNGACTGPNTCSCTSGWSGPICDQCQLPVDCPADRATCNVPGDCNCDPGYSGLVCQFDDDVCGHTMPCLNNGTCSNNGSDLHTCTCPAGYTGVNCESEIDPCTDSGDQPCQNYGTCTKTGPGLFNCSCIAGWTGTLCDEEMDVCALSSPCVHGNCSNCQATGPVIVDPTNPDFVFCPLGYLCHCPDGFFGDNCDVETDDCTPNPCVNQGACHNVIGGPGYSCICPTGFNGTNCEVDIDECLDSPCLNGGNCTNGAGYYNCSCPQGFTGQDCQIDIDECLTANCSVNNTFQCIDGPGHFTCECRTGYTGTLCDEEFDPCDPDPCQNGTCTRVGSDFTCACHVGFTGAECGVDIDYCVSPEVCLNGGTCVDGLSTYSCECTPLFTGDQCETDRDPCSPFPCGLGEGCLVEATEPSGYFCEACSIIVEDTSLGNVGCNTTPPSIIDPGASTGNIIIIIFIITGAVIGGIVGAISLLLLIIALIVCCVKYCACCMAVKENETEPEYETLPRNSAQQNPLYLGTNTLLSSQSGTLKGNRYGSTSPPVPESNYERIRSPSSNEVDLGPVQNPMYALSQSINSRLSYQPPSRVPTADSSISQVTFFPPPDASGNHYEPIPAQRPNPPRGVQASGQYDSLTTKPLLETSLSNMKSGKYDSLSPTNIPSPPGPPPKVAQSNHQVPAPVENPYELVMAPSKRGEEYVMLPPMEAFSTLKDDVKKEKKPNQPEELYDVPLSRENPYEFS